MAEEKEIDLLDVIAYIVNHSIKRKVAIILIFILCLAIPVTYYYVKDKKYSSKMTLTTNSLSIALIEQISEPLSTSINYSQSSLSSELLGIDEKQASVIKYMELEQVKEPLPDNTEGIVFTIEYTSIDKDIFSSLEEPTLNFLNENRFIKQIIEVQREQLEKYHGNILEQMARLDSVQRIIPKAINDYTQSDKISWNDFNLGLVYQQMVSLKSTEMEVAEKLEFVNECRIVSGFVIVQPTKSLLFFILVGIGGGLLLNFGYLILMAIGETISRKKAS